MKTFKAICLLLFLLMNSVPLIWAGSDLTVKAHFSPESTDAFLDNLRHFLIRSNFGDPYEQQLDRPIRVDLGKSLTELPPDIKNWLQDFQELFNLKLFESNYELVVENFNYSIGRFKTQVTPMLSLEDRVEYVTKSSIQGLKLGADVISFQVTLNRSQSQTPLSFKIEIISPEFTVHEKLAAEIEMRWTTAILPENILFNLHLIDIQKIMNEIVSHPEHINFRFENIKIPKLSFRIGSKEIRIDENKIRNFLLTREEDLKKGILNLLQKQEERFSNIIKSRPKSLLLPKIFGFNSDISGYFSLENIKLVLNKIVQFDLTGGFCKQEVESFQDKCLDKEFPKNDRRLISDTDYQQSLAKIDKKLLESTANIAVSISESYLNQVIESTIRSGLWEAMLKETDFELGPEKAFVLAEEEGETFSLYLDIIYKLRGARRILVGRSELKFPIKFGIIVQIEEKNKIPHLKIKVKKIQVTREHLLSGIPLYGLESTVGSVPRFREKVIAEIMNEVNSYLDQDLLEIEFKELEGTYFKHLEFYSDGLGRGTALIGLDKTGRNFTNFRLK